jgi:general secretion pathway protein J
MPTWRGRLRPRRGFTLLELLLAITLTAIAAGAAGTALSAARTASARVATHRAQGEAASRFRAMLTDLLHHAPAAEAVSEPLLVIGRDAVGTTLQFLSQGVRPPFGTGPVWRVRVSRDGDRLLLRADPLGADRSEPSVMMALTDMASFEVLALERANGLEGARWRPDWPLAQRRPAALALSWTRRDADDAPGRDGGQDAPFVVALDPLEAGRP